MQTEKVATHITNWLKNYAKTSKVNGFVIGISGGIDSAVTSALCAKTGLDTLCVEMPIHQDSKQVSRAKTHIEQLKNQFPNVSDVCIELTKSFDSLQNTLPISDNIQKYNLSLANTRARLRMTTLYYLAGIHGYLVVGTGNKIEDFGVGFFTKYGDGGVDISPIADLLKSEVYALGKILNVSESIINAAPTDGLFGDSRTDEDQLGASYNELEWAMNAYLQNKTPNDFDGRKAEVLNIYTRLHHANLHKINPIPVCKIPQEFK
ncbi:NAD+ synthase [Mesonia hippocampi]|uniref:NH(3)-dependent NAD(+) synthetase n=1 Tax=Mesonia hippocampi TaxID=1628250 RepID=A0A840EKI2_9FLAO|nr:NAD(+) synthase [Mesonia hippocampi]MBB4118658.1 NAD+ synthase [Mesonia hippocampi]